jgi:hypothetical protein
LVVENPVVLSLADVKNLIVSWIDEAIHIIRSSRSFFLLLSRHIGG